MINRRKLLKATAVGGSGLAALAYSPQPTLAASNWTANSPSQVSNENGELSSLEIPSSGFSFSLNYSGLGAGPHSIEFELEAKLSSDSSFETVFTDLFEVNGDEGTVDESKLSTSFPVDLLAETSLSASDFNEPNAGETETTTVDLRASFDWSDSEYSASDSATTSFVVDVVNEAPQYLQAHWSFETDGSDVTGNGYDATAVTATHRDSGAHDGSGAYEFNADSRVAAPFPQYSSFTYSIWARRDGNGSHNANYIMKADDPWGEKTGFAFIVWNSGDFEVRLGDGSSINGSTFSGHMSNSNWHHLTIVYDGSSYTVYDGATELTTVSTGSISWGSLGITFGKKHNENGGANRFNGILSDARLYNKAFTQQEVEDLHNETKA